MNNVIKLESLVDFFSEYDNHEDTRWDMFKGEVSMLCPVGYKVVVYPDYEIYVQDVNSEFGISIPAHVGTQLAYSCTKRDLQEALDVICQRLERCVASRRRFGNE